MHVATGHTTALVSNVAIREHQMRDLFDAIDAVANVRTKANVTVTQRQCIGQPSVMIVDLLTDIRPHCKRWQNSATRNDALLIMGDMNLHRPSEDRLIRGDYSDLWAALRPDDPGYVSFAAADSFVAHFWPSMHKSR